MVVVVVAGWGAEGRLAEVPEAFWKLVSPKTHGEIREHLFEQARLLLWPGFN